MEILIDILFSLGGAVAAFITLGITERFVKPKAMQVADASYEYLKGYVQPTLDRLDFNLAILSAENIVDEAILPQELSKEEKQQLLNLVAKAFSLEVYLSKTKQS